MGQIPEARVKPSKPFTNSEVKQGGKRNRTTVKCYVALFVCLYTEAIHLELVSELSTEAYIASLRIFIARRGLCTNICSDNGTNFVGPEKELKKIIFEKESIERISWFATQQGINFHFIPLCAAHMGGIWEAGVKVDEISLTYSCWQCKIYF